MPAPPDDDFYARMRAMLEPLYAAAATPWEQSGFSGPEARWEALRRPVADAIDRDGAFLDIGCANGYLAECVARWTSARGLAVELSGIDLSPPRRYDFVRTEIVYVPAADEAAYLAHLLDAFVAPGGALLVCNYCEDSPDVAARILPGAHPTTNILDRLAALGFPATEFHDGHDPDPLKARRTRVALVRR